MVSVALSGLISGFFEGINDRVEAESKARREVDTYRQKIIDQNAAETERMIAVEREKARLEQEKEAAFREKYAEISGTKMSPYDKAMAMANGDPQAAARYFPMLEAQEQARRSQVGSRIAYGQPTDTTTALPASPDNIIKPRTVTQKDQAVLDVLSPEYAGFEQQLQENVPSQEQTNAQNLPNPQLPPVPSPFMKGSFAEKQAQIKKEVEDFNQRVSDANSYDPKGAAERKAAMENQYRQLEAKAEEYGIALSPESKQRLKQNADADIKRLIPDAELNSALTGVNVKRQMITVLQSGKVKEGSFAELANEAGRILGLETATTDLYQGLSMNSVLAKARSVAPVTQPDIDILKRMGPDLTKTRQGKEMLLASALYQDLNIRDKQNFISKAVEKGIPVNVAADAFNSFERDARVFLGDSKNTGSIRVNSLLLNDKWRNTYMNNLLKVVYEYPSIDNPHDVAMQLTKQAEQ